MSIPMCVIQTSNFIAQHVACKNKYRNKYLDYVRLGNKTHLFACKDLYEKLMHFMHLECTCIGRKSHHTLSTRSHRSLLKCLFLEEYLYTHTILFVLKSFFQVAIFTTLGLLLIRYPFITPCYLGKYVFSLFAQPSCKYFRIFVVFVNGENYKLL